MDISGIATVVGVVSGWGAAVGAWVLSVEKRLNGQALINQKLDAIVQTGTRVEQQQNEQGKSLDALQVRVHAIDVRTSRVKP